MTNKILDWTQTLTIIASIIGFGYFLNTIHREDMRVMREDMRRMDDRWEKLFEKFHILDKDVATVKGEISVKKAS